MFIVFTSYNFDMETHAYECETREEALEIMHEIFKTETEESCGVNKDETYIEDTFNYAKITWSNNNGTITDDYMEINVVETEKYRRR